MNIHGRLERIFQDAFGIDKLTDDMSIDTVPGWDSMSHVGLIMAIQQEFAVSVSPADAIELADVKSIKTYLKGSAYDGRSA